MAVELGRFLSGKLEELPADHPDRVFLQGIAQTTTEYINKKLLPQDMQVEESAHGTGLVGLGQVLREKRKETKMS